MDTNEDVGLEEVCISGTRAQENQLTYPAPEIRPLVIYWEDRGRGNHQTRRQRHSPIHRRLDRVRLGPNRYATPRQYLISANMEG